MGKPIAVIYTSDDVIADRETLADGLKRIAQGTWKDFKLTNQSAAGKAAKFGAGVVVAGSVAKTMEAYTPLKWLMKGFGPLPAEFTKSGAIQVFEFTTVERLRRMAIATGSKFVLVTVAFEGGVLIGSLINQALPEAAKDSIGGTLNEIINEGGWKELWRHPFGIGL